MSDEIVRRLMRGRKSLEFLAEDVDPLYEAEKDPDEEYAALNRDEEEEEYDDSTAPEQGTPDDEVPEEDTESPEQDSAEDTESEPEPSIPHDSSSPAPKMSEEEPTGEEDMIEEPTPEPEEKEGYDNPLDNNYAVNYTLGDDIQLEFTGDTKDIKTGVIDGYDQEGFYRVKWSDGTTTSGMTDIALSEFIRTKKVSESKCVCGSIHIVKENNKRICDDCGRVINENSLDALTIADKSRPKDKRMIRSMAHPVSTAVKPDIAEAIKNALRGDKLLEEDDPDIESSVFDALKELDNEFWTRKDEMKSDIEELGYYVDEMNSEYVVVSSDEDEENAYLIPINGTSRTMTLDFSKARMI